ncbi:MAG: sigma-70 family RNA polymerase sigma factor [Chthoniobacterales bacterium]|nr:sigma-70 family RNA polymerase sigma factor [Chthoniobacterales bacterium]
MLSSPPREEVTRILGDWGDGDHDAPRRLMPLVYEELRRIARRYLERERIGHTLQATALVHEAYLQLVDQKTATWQNRAHFFGIAAQTMRRILVDYARSRGAEKRGGNQEKLSFDEALDFSDERTVDLVALDDALKDLASFDQRQSDIVEMRFFGGLTNEEIGEFLHISPRTIKREWRLARAWLRREIVGEGAANAAGG